MKQLGTPGDRWALARVFGAMIVGAIVAGLVGYLFDLAVGPLIGQSGWWTVFASGGLIAGAALQAVREFTNPLPVSSEVGPAEGPAGDPAEPQARR